MLPPGSRWLVWFRTPEDLCFGACVDSQTVGTLVGEIHFEVENHTKKSDASWDWLGFIESD